MTTRYLLALAAFCTLIFAQQQPNQPKTPYGPTTESKPGPHRTEQNEGRLIQQQQQNGKQDQNGLLGIISDSKCGRVHSVYPGLGATGCARVCVNERGASYILVTKDRVVPLSGNKKILENYAGESVLITGGTNIQREDQIHASYTPGMVVPVSTPK